MSISELRLFKRCAEFRPKEDYRQIPHATRGIYALLKQQPNKKFDVVYVGMARGLKSGIRGRLFSHFNDNMKRDLWTHFSIYEVWDNITESEIAELEGVFRHIYRRDIAANRINKQRSFAKLRRVRQNNLKSWVKDS
jgi:hypothetical protein